MFTTVCCVPCQYVELLTMTSLLPCLLIDEFSFNKHLFTQSLHSFIHHQIFIEILHNRAGTMMGSGGAETQQEARIPVGGRQTGKENRTRQRTVSVTIGV